MPNHNFDHYEYQLYSRALEKTKLNKAKLGESIGKVRPDKASDDVLRYWDYQEAIERFETQGPEENLHFSWWIQAPWVLRRIAKHKDPSNPHSIQARLASKCKTLGIKMPPSFEEAAEHGLFKEFFEYSSLQLVESKLVKLESDCRFKEVLEDSQNDFAKIRELDEYKIIFKRVGEYQAVIKEVLPANLVEVQTDGSYLPHKDLVNLRSSKLWCENYVPFLTLGILKLNKTDAEAKVRASFERLKNSKEMKDSVANAGIFFREFVSKFAVRFIVSEDDMEDPFTLNLIL